MSHKPGGDKSPAVPVAEGAAAAEGGPAVKDRWWVDTGDKKRERAAAAPVSTVGKRFYRSGDGFDQDKARTALSDNNRRLLLDANPAEAEWAYVQLAEKPHNQQNRERILAQVTLPPYARGVLVDCGRTVRLLVTGTPIGDRVLDLTLVDSPSFDCWIEGEWVRERVFRDQRSALGALRRFIPELLSPEGIAAGESIRARV